VENFKSPYIGVTKAGTQRVVYASKNLVWATSLIPIIKQQNKLRMKSLKTRQSHISEGIKERIKTFKIKSWHTYL
jgi:hypothetical protein